MSGGPLFTPNTEKGFHEWKLQYPKGNYALIITTYPKDPALACQRVSEQYSVKIV